MKYVEWCELFRIGQDKIDSQHKVLFDISNQFHDEANKGFDSKVTIETMNQLINYAQKHFADEEKLTARLNLPEEILTAHKKVHEQLIMDIFDLHADISSGKINSMSNIQNFLREWLVLHILTEDNKYKEHLE